LNLAKVVGKIWATRKDKSLEDAVLLIIQPVNGDGSQAGGRLAALDIVSADQGQLVYFVSSKEAALPLKNPLTPVDACIVGIVDSVDGNQS
jgi:ethanolamine utilization protein EutN